MRVNLVQTGNPGIPRVFSTARLCSARVFLFFNQKSVVTAREMASAFSSDAAPGP
jgi:hypothetical protein